MKAIVAVSKEWGIGKDNKLLFSIPEDMKFFKNKTIGNTVIMGRKTLESFPGGKPLKDRRNIVLTLNPDYDGKGAVTVHSLKELFNEVDESPGEVYVIGGESIYSLLFPFMDTVYVTKVDDSPQADTYFPNLDRDENWEQIECSEVKKHENLTYQFTTYKRIGKNA